MHFVNCVLKSGVQTMPLGDEQCNNDQRFTCPHTKKYPEKYLKHMRDARMRHSII